MEVKTMSEYYTCDEIAAKYKVQKLTIYSWIKNKKLGALKLGREYRISQDDLDTFENNCRTIE